MGWNQLAQKAEAIKEQHSDDFIFSDDDYKTSAELNLYLPEMIYAQNVIGKNALQFDFIGTNLDSLNNKNALFIDSDPGFNDNQRSNNIPAKLSGYFDSVTELDPILINKGDRVIRKFYVYDCKNYHPLKTK